MELGVDVSKGGVEDHENILRGKRGAVGVKLEPYGGGGGGVVVGGWWEVAGGMST